MKKLRIILADDHAMLRSGLRALVEAQPDMEVVAEAENGRVALEKIRAHQPDVLVLDISMPDQNGIQAMREIERTGLKVRALILSAYGDTAYVRQMLGAGAAGYVLKKSAACELITAIRAIAGGGIYLDPALAATVARGLVHEKRLRGNRQGGECSEREVQVIRYVAQGHTNKEVAALLGVSVKTVETHKAACMEKLELKSRAEVVRYALHQGWLED